ncbi:hypothetical protein [Mangrovicoccus ximenensis]|uniref:hypothetical protein n=1 Tax=Mangrovicoccus ximenensis TaxID=1911570 RepID=UPI000D3B4155|nr:hypothetical protein [Mangrovicoccus ximenensis]
MAKTEDFREHLRRLSGDFSAVASAGALAAGLLAISAALVQTAGFPGLLMGTVIAVSALLPVICALFLSIAVWETAAAVFLPRCSARLRAAVSVFGAVSGTVIAFGGLIVLLHGAF